MLQLVLLTVFPLLLMAQASKGVVINGHMPGLKNGEKVILVLYSSGVSQPLDSAVVNNSKFHLEAKIPGGARYCELYFDQHTGDNFKFVRLFF